MKRATSVMEMLYWILMIAVLVWSVVETPMAETWLWHKVSRGLQRAARTIGEAGLEAERQYHLSLERERY